MALVGSRGDVEPGLVVAAGLRARGHEVVLGVAPNLVGHARARGLDAVPVGVDSRAFLESDVVRRDLRAASPVRRVRALRAVAADGWTPLRTGLLALVRRTRAELVVTGLLGQEVGSAVAEATGCAFAALHYAPVRANGAVGLLPAGVPGSRSPRVRATTWRLGERVRWDLTRPAENAQRAALGLAPAVVDLPRRLRERGALEIQAYDPLLVPGLAEQWGARRPLVGWLRPTPPADEGAVPDGTHPGDSELEELLAQEPVYVGFGSMPVSDPAALLRTLAAAGRAVERPVLLAAGWSGVDHLDPVPGVLVRPGVDHDRVLPRCAVAVHHGGAGTVGAVLHAGLGSVVAWWSADQPVWAGLLAQAGLGVGGPFRRLDAPTLAAQLQDRLAPAARGRARAARARLVPPSAARAACVAALERAV